MISWQICVSLKFVFVLTVWKVFSLGVSQSQSISELRSLSTLNKFIYSKIGELTH